MANGVSKVCRAVALSAFGIGGSTSLRAGSSWLTHDGIASILSDVAIVPPWVVAEYHGQSKEFVVRQMHCHFWEPVEFFGYYSSELVSSKPECGLSRHVELFEEFP